MNGNLTLPNLESALDEPIVIGSTGSVASGKSTFLSALHAALGYDRAGKRIDKDTLRGRSRLKVKPDAIKRLHMGVFRTNATVRPDLLQVYGVKDGKIYFFDFYSQGGHTHATQLEQNLDGLLYFVDMNLAKSCAVALENEKTFRWKDETLPLYGSGEVLVKRIEELLRRSVVYNDFGRNETQKEILDGLAQYLGVQASDRLNFHEAIKDVARQLALTAVKDMPVFGLPVQAGERWVEKKRQIQYKGESLGEVVQSVINSHKYAQLKSREGVPVVGVGTHQSSVYGQFPNDKEGILAVVQGIFNKTIAKYMEYRAEQGVPAEDFVLDLLNGPAADWHFVELLRKITITGILSHDKFLLNTKNIRTVETAYDIMTKALSHRVVNPDGFKIVTFAKKQSDFTIYSPDILTLVNFK